MRENLRNFTGTFKQLIFKSDENGVKMIKKITDRQTSG